MAATVVEILSADEIRRTLTRLASEIIEKVGDLSRVVLVGIHTRGVPLAESLAAQIMALEACEIPVGQLDITFYRDDLNAIGMRTPAKSTMPCDLTDRIVVLVDDVIYKGRTVRAALNAVGEFGRPDLIYLAVLVDRGHRQLPIHPDFTGRHLPTSSEEQVRVYLQGHDGYDVVQLIRAD